VHGVAVNPGDDRVYLATQHGLFRYDGTLRASQDGRQWRDLQIAAPPTALAASPDGHTVLAATGAGLLRSIDAA
jgi:hypothetical protein